MAKDEEGMPGFPSVNSWTNKQRHLLRLERDEEKACILDTIEQLPAQTTRPSFHLNYSTFRHPVVDAVSLEKPYVCSVSITDWLSLVAISSECVERGVSLLPLVVRGVSTGLYGRACVSVGDPKGRPLPAHRLGAGDEVRLYSTKGHKGHAADEGPTEVLGVVSKVTEATLEIVSDEADEAGSLRAPLRLDLSVSEATIKKMMLGLDALEKYQNGGPAERIVSVLFGMEPPSAVAAATGASSLDAFHPMTRHCRRLNDSQREAVAFALMTRDVALIHGPPGTGKTTTVVALILEAVARGWRCLVCAPSNVAVDGILEKLLAAEEDVPGGKSDGGGKGGRPRVVRLGHPARLLPQAVEHSLEALVSRHEGTAIVKDVRGELDALLGQLNRTGVTSGSAKARNRERFSDRKSARREVKALRKEARAREEKVVREVMASKDVVLATCVGAATFSLRNEEFDLVVIDEAAQALEAACWIPILKGKRLVLAGDHKQLAPTVKSRAAEIGETANAFTSDGAPKGSNGLGLTMFDRVMRDHGSGVSRMLNLQYRMHEDICKWASREMYDGLLRAHPSVATRTLADLPHAAGACDMTAAVMLLVDTTGCDMPEEEAGGGSRRNQREAEVTVTHVKNLLEAGLLEKEIAVISPYNGQVNLLKGLVRSQHPGVEIRSVDGFQGGEKEAIVLSLVRSNPGKQVGFLGDARRLNVAVTRAKRHVAVVCDAECCGSDAFIGRLVRYIEEKGEFRSALELELELGLDTNAADRPVDDEQVAVSTTAEIGLGSPPVQEIVRGSGDIGSAKHPPSQTIRAELLASESRPDTSSSREQHVHKQGLRPQHPEESKGKFQETIPTEKILARVREFAKASNSLDGVPAEGIGELVLPPELSARQRALVHEAAEALGLEHASQGDGPRRRLVLRRKPCEEPKQDPTEAVDDCRSDSSSGRDADIDEGRLVPTLFQAMAMIDGTEKDDGTSDVEKSGGEALEQNDETQESPKQMNPPTSHGQKEDPTDEAAFAGANSTLPSANALLASLHAERRARGSPSTAASSVGAQGRRENKGAAGQGPSGATPSPVDDRGFGPESVPGCESASGSRRSSVKKKSGKKKTGGHGRGSRSTVSSSSSARSGRNLEGQGKGPADDKDGGEGDDDDMAFLDSQIRQQRASEPCYAGLLRSTNEVMRERNPAWARLQDERKPSRSTLGAAARGNLKSALDARLAEDEKKRARAGGSKGESKR